MILLILSSALYASEIKANYQSVAGASLGASAVCQRPGVGTDRIYKTCPLIRDTDLNPIFENCLNEIEESDDECKEAYAGVATQSAAIKASFQRYEARRAAEKANPNQERQSRSIQEMEQEIGLYLDSMNRATQFECRKPEVLATSALDVVSLISPVGARMGLAVQSVFQSLSGLFKNLRRRSDFSKKLKLCDLNVRMQMARQSMCEAVYFHRKTLQDRQASGNNDADASEDNLATHYYRSVSDIKDMIAAFNLEDFESSQRAAVLQAISRTLDTNYRALQCSDAIPYCRSIALMRNNFRTAAEAKNSEARSLIASAQDHARLMQIRGGDLNSIGLSRDQVQHGFNYFVDEIREELAESVESEVFLFADKTRYNATPIVDIVTDMRRLDLYELKDDEKRQYCDATACFWAPSTIVAPENASSINWKNIAGMDMRQAITPQRVERSCRRNATLSDSENGLLRYIQEYSSGRLSCNDRSAYNSLMDLMSQTQSVCSNYSVARCNLNCSSELTDLFVLQDTAVESRKAAPSTTEAER